MPDDLDVDPDEKDENEDENEPDESGKDGKDTGKDGKDDDTPLSASEAAAIRAALKKANAEAKQYRLEAKKLREQNESENEKALREARESAATEVEGKYKRKIVNAEAKALLAQAGLTSNSDRFVRMVDLEAVTVTEEGDVDGLDDQISAIKDEFPELFKTEETSTRPRRRSNGSLDAGHRSGRSDKPMSSAEKIASQVLSGR